MNKKTYMLPRVRIVTVQTGNLIAESFTKGEGDFDPENMHYVKGDRSGSRSDYNVWGDDWSKE